MQGGIIIGDVDPKQALVVGQRQLKQLAQEILRSANVGIGYAFSIQYVQDEINRLNDKESN